MANTNTDINNTLPSTRILLTQILSHLSTLSNYPSPSSPHHLAAPLPSSLTTTNLPATTKPLLLTLHSLLPHCLLPALDLLDRGLVQRWVPSTANSTENTPPSSSWVYYITSKPSNSTNPATSNIYEVRPSIWHCTCANFTLYAFTSNTTNGSCITTDQLDNNNNNDNNKNDNLDINTHTLKSSSSSSWIWGTTTLSSSHPPSIPICKHLLAAVLAEQCPDIFGRNVKEKRDIEKEQMAEMACWWD